MAESEMDARIRTAAQAFGSLVRHHRQERRISQMALARIAGVSRGFVIDLERGKGSAQLGLALVIAQAVGVPGVGLLTTLSPVASPPAGQGDDDLPDMEDADVGSPRVL